MQPLSPAQKKDLMKNGATADEIEEYEKLLAERFTSGDPQKAEDRLKELAEKLYGAK